MSEDNQTLAAESTTPRTAEAFIPAHSRLIPGSIQDVSESPSTVDIPVLAAIGAVHKRTRQWKVRPFDPERDKTWDQVEPIRDVSAKVERLNDVSPKVERISADVVAKALGGRPATGKDRRRDRR